MRRLIQGSGQARVRQVQKIKVVCSSTNMTGEFDQIVVWCNPRRPTLLVPAPKYRVPRESKSCLVDATELSHMSRRGCVYGVRIGRKQSSTSTGLLSQTVLAFDQCC